MRRSSIFFCLASFLCCFSALARSRSRALRAAAAGLACGFASATGVAVGGRWRPRFRWQIACRFTRRWRLGCLPVTRSVPVLVGCFATLCDCEVASGLGRCRRFRRLLQRQVLAQLFPATTSATLTAAGGASLASRRSSGSDLRATGTAVSATAAASCAGVSAACGSVAVETGWKPILPGSACGFALRWEPARERPPDPGQSASSRSSRSSAKSPATAAADRPVH